MGKSMRSSMQDMISAEERMSWIDPKKNTLVQDIICSLIMIAIFYGFALMFLP